MGIPKLSTFVDQRFTEWQHRVLAANEKLVIDGINICYQLYGENHDWTRGGSYREFYDTVTAFFQALLASKIEPIVIVDGINEEKKNETTRSRREKSFKMMKDWQKNGRVHPNVLPLLAKEVFVDALQDLEIELCVVDGEADPEIVAVANSYECPVLAQDSDFYMFNIVGGYIPFSRFKLSRSTGRPEADVFHMQDFANQFGLRDKDLRFLIPAILGNDFLKRVNFRGLNAPNTIVQYVRQFPTMDNFIAALSKEDSKPVRKNCQKAVEIYTIPPRSLREVATTTKLGIPDWILPKYRAGCFESFMVSAAVLGCVIFRANVDEVDKGSSHLAGKEIRRSIYGILGCTKVTETIRSDGRIHLVDIGVEPCIDPSCPDIALIGHDEGTLERRQSAFCSILHCSREEIDQLPPEWQLVVVASSYWFRNAKPYIPPHIAKALVYTFLACSQGHYPRRLERVFAARSPRKNYSPEALHAFAQWQSVYFNALSLNQLLQEPFRYITPSHLYDGETAMHYAVIPCTEEAVLKDLEWDDWTLYKNLMCLITGGRKNKKKSDAATVTIPKVPVVPPKPRKEQSRFAQENRFDILAHLTDLND